MEKDEWNKIIEKADFIVAGYAFTKRDDGLISIIDINAPYHAAIINAEGDVLETNMYDIELDIVINKYWCKNKSQIIA